MVVWYTICFCYTCFSFYLNKLHCTYITRQSIKKVHSMCQSAMSSETRVEKLLLVVMVAVVYGIMLACRDDGGMVHGRKW